MPQLTWLITGCTSGFGVLLAEIALGRGDRVIATARGGLERLTGLKQAGAAVLELDVISPQAELDKIVEKAIKIYGGIDVLVNNAAYIDAALVETLSHERLLASFNTNLFGAINLTRAILPHFRQKKDGILVYLGSVGGWNGAVGTGAYCATKFAMEGYVECLQLEINSFGIRSVIFEPGYYRTKMFHPDNVKVSDLTIPDYKESYDGLMAMVANINGRQPGDPKKACELMVDVVRQEGLAAGKQIPPRLPIGADGIREVRNKCMATLKLVEEWESVVSDTNV
ncbi:putative oxidoreductase [Lachnellula occidentalis]|uniref:Putative oxidoreductase n=1 Tax=Lachnellula occidentalis TaxID=215460 RepID=A0A8H8RSI6_9HELO|nr:putative oxidoreductase [Lachnellula occidentalis]